MREGFLGLGHTILRLLDTNQRDPDMNRAMMIELNASVPKRLPLSTYASNKGIDKINTYANVPRIMNRNRNMVFDAIHRSFWPMCNFSWKAVIITQSFQIQVYISQFFCL